ncbi:MAG: amidohydrolase family protein [Actinomycetia bacterium]|nr:amidohydrolase family protein [Actinomycetes bacterium]
MLLEADWVLPISGPPMERGAVLVVDGTIEAVGPAAALRARHPGESVETFPGCALLPGLVNSHSHLEYSAFRGFTRARGFGSWMGRLLLARRKLDADDFAASALWGAYECARSGVTSIADTAFEGEAVVRAARAAGLRSRVYLEVFGLDDDRLPQTMARLEAGLARLQRECEGGGRDGCAGPGRGPKVEAGVSPHAPYTVSARLYREVARFARRAGLRVATHVAESRAEVDLLIRGTSAISQAYRAAHLWNGQKWSPPRSSPIRYVAAAGALGRETLVIHAVQVDADDIALLAMSEAAVAHCPRSNLRLRCGAAPAAEMMSVGVHVGLGTDSLASNENLDMFAEMRTALRVSVGRAASGARPRASKAEGVTPDEPCVSAALTPAAVLRMATLEGARALGWDHMIGSLEAGKRADIIAVALRSPESVSARARGSGPAQVDPVTELVGAATAADVRMTMVEGEVVCRGSALPAEVERAFRKVCAKLAPEG